MSGDPVIIFPGFCGVDEVSVTNRSDRLKLIDGSTLPGLSDAYMEVNFSGENELAELLLGHLIASQSVEIAIPMALSKKQCVGRWTVQALARRPVCYATLCQDGPLRLEPIGEPALAALEHVARSRFLATGCMSLNQARRELGLPSLDHPKPGESQ
jgi:hypothetical protein